MKILTMIVVAGSLMAQGPPVPKPTPVAPKSASKAKKTPDIVAEITQPESSTRTIHYNDRIIEPVHCKLNFTTLIVLPANEKIMEAALGNTDEWTANPSAGSNVAYVRPDHAKARTNLNLVAASGNIYSFLVVEGDGSPDLKVFVDTKQSEQLAAMSSKPKWVLASELDAAKKSAEDATKEADAAREDFNKKSAAMRSQADSEIAAFRSGFPSSLKHDYKFKDNQREFGIHAIAHDKDHTYIWCDPQEVPALYEVKDGKPAILQYEYANGVYVTSKVLQSAYLQVGKHKLEFRKQGY